MVLINSGGFFLRYDLTAFSTPYVHLSQNLDYTKTIKKVLTEVWLEPKPKIPEVSWYYFLQIGYKD